MAKLIRWDTPFTNSFYPSVVLLATPFPLMSKKGVGVKAVVAPDGVDKYPKYLVNFGEVIAFTCFEEAHAPERDFASATVEEERLCAYEYLDSPWLKSYAAWSPFFFGNETDSFYHYLIFGGDFNIEVVTPNKPTIEIVEEKTILQIEREV
jgi:hypothetical protein